MCVIDSTDTLTLRFDTITQKSFEQYKKNYRLKFKVDTTNITQNDSCLTIQTQDSIFAFHFLKYDFGNGSTDGTYYYYMGLLAPVGLYVVMMIDTHNEIGDVLLVDDKTSKRYQLASEFDDPCEVLLVSPKNKYMISFANNYYEDNQCFFTIIGVSKNKGAFSYKAVKVYDSNEWRIKDVVWINENSFAMEIITTTRDENSNNPIETVSYLKVSF